ncbi:polysaccharide biosynthesis tyrosine autokinase [Ornithinimicrobium pratense]|nr:polysaccharide biosynthesis tyrosine autokinase [Ornithinimicrobium pratense]
MTSFAHRLHLRTHVKLSDYLHIVQRSWRLVATTTLVALLLGATLTALTTRQYRAEAELFVSTAGGDTVTDLVQGGSFTQRQVATYADIVTTPIVLDPVIEQLGLDTSSRALASQVSATVPPNTVLIQITVTDANPGAAANLANAVAGQFADTIQDLERTGTGESPVSASIVRPATASNDPASPNVVQNLSLSLTLGLLLGLGLSALRHVIDTRVRGEEDVRRVSDAPTLGAVHYDKDAAKHPLVVHLDPHSSRSEAFRALRTNLLYLDPDHQPRTLLVTSTIPGEGKSTSTANLALTLAATGSTVCLIEGDLRRPRLLEYMGLVSSVGLTDVLVGRAELEDVLQDFGDGLRVLGCGPIPPNPSELLGSDAMRRLLDRLSGKFDYVVIDAPPLLAVTDAAVLSTLVDGTIVVVGTGLVRREQLERALGHLNRVESRVLGTVLNRVPIKGPDAYSYSYEAYAPQLPGAPKGQRKHVGRAKFRSGSD